MDADIMDSKKLFREIEIPKELLENILLIPAELDPCPNAPTIKIERKLSFKQIKEMMAHEEETYRAICQMVDVDAIDNFLSINFEIPTFKETLIIKDISLLSEIVATAFYSKIRSQTQMTIRNWAQTSDWSRLYQIVEIDWSLRDLYPGEQHIHYEIFTKREIFIKAEDNVQEKT